MQNRSTRHFLAHAIGVGTTALLSAVRQRQTDPETRGKANDTSHLQNHAPAWPGRGRMAVGRQL